MANIGTFLSCMLYTLHTFSCTSWFIAPTVHMVPLSQLVIAIFGKENREEQSVYLEQYSMATKFVQTPVRCPVMDVLDHL